MDNAKVSVTALKMPCSMIARREVTQPASNSSGTRWRSASGLEREEASCSLTVMHHLDVMPDPPSPMYATHDSPLSGSCAAACFRMGST